MSLICLLFGLSFLFFGPHERVQLLRARVSFAVNCPMARSQPLGTVFFFIFSLDVTSSQAPKSNPSWVQIHMYMYVDGVVCPFFFILICLAVLCAGQVERDSEKSLSVSMYYSLTLTLFLNFLQLLFLSLPSCHTPSFKTTDVPRKGKQK